MGFNLMIFYSLIYFVSLFGLLFLFEESGALFRTEMTTIVICRAANPRHPESGCGAIGTSASASSLSFSPPLPGLPTPFLASFSRFFRPFSQSNESPTKKKQEETRRNKKKQEEEDEDDDDKYLFIFDGIH